MRLTPTRYSAPPTLIPQPATIAIAPGPQQIEGFSPAYAPATAAVWQASRGVRFGVSPEEMSLDRGLDVDPAVWENLAQARTIRLDSIMEVVNTSLGEATDWQLQRSRPGGHELLTEYYEEFSFKIQGKTYTLRQFKMSQRAGNYVKTPQYRIRSNESLEFDISQETYSRLAQQCRPLAVAALGKTLGMDVVFEPRQFVDTVTKALLTRPVTEEDYPREAPLNPEMIYLDKRDHHMSVTFPRQDGSSPLEGKMICIRRLQSLTTDSVVYQFRIQDAETWTVLYSHMVGQNPPGTDIAADQALFEASKRLLTAAELVKTEKFAQAFLDEIPATDTPQPDDNAVAVRALLTPKLGILRDRKAALLRDCQ